MNKQHVQIKLIKYNIFINFLLKCCSSERIVSPSVAAYYVHLTLTQASQYARNLTRILTCPVSRQLQCVELTSVLRLPSCV